MEQWTNLDEGFGTLDEECLNVVMDTLELLHQMGGHRVGVISHVEALNDRIHAQVQVKRVDPSKSKVEVRRTWPIARLSWMAVRNDGCHGGLPFSMHGREP